ncbi:hypothetical protein Bca4012_031961 [Brassica carinata]
MKMKRHASAYQSIIFQKQKLPLTNPIMRLMPPLEQIFFVLCLFLKSDGKLEREREREREKIYI